MQVQDSWCNQCHFKKFGDSRHFCRVAPTNWQWPFFAHHTFGGQNEKSRAKNGNDFFVKMVMIFFCWLVRLFEHRKIENQATNKLFFTACPSYIVGPSARVYHAKAFKRPWIQYAWGHFFLDAVVFCRVWNTL